jgi:Lysylphosphatidylglycerol synthase TM region
MRRILILALAITVTTAAVWYVLTPQTINAVTQALARGDWRLLAIAFALNAAIQWVRAWRFAIMTQGDIVLPDARLVRITFQLNFFNFILPFKLGELSYPVQMNRICGQPFLNAAGILLAARVLDLSTVGAILLLSAYLLGIPAGNAASAVCALSATTLIVLPSVFVLLAGIEIPNRGPRWLNSIATSLAAGIRPLRNRWAAAATILLSYVVWLMFALLSILTATAVVGSLGPLIGLFGAAANNLAFALPVTGIAGLGPSQAAWVFAVTRAGVPWDDAVISALALYAVNLVSALFCGCASLIGSRRNLLGTVRPKRIAEHH